MHTLFRLVNFQNLGFRMEATANAKSSVFFLLFFLIFSFRVVREKIMSSNLSGRREGSNAQGMRPSTTAVDGGNAKSFE